MVSYNTVAAVLYVGFIVVDIVCISFIVLHVIIFGLEGRSGYFYT